MPVSSFKSPGTDALQYPVQSGLGIFMVIVMMGVTKVMIVLAGGLGGNCFCYEEAGVVRERAG